MFNEGQICKWVRESFSDDRGYHPKSVEIVKIEKPMARGFYRVLNTVRLETSVASENELFVLEPTEIVKWRLR